MIYFLIHYINKKVAINITKRTLEDIENDFKKLKIEKRLFLKKQKEEERKKRTKKLIEIGAIVESFFGEFESPEELKLFLQILDEKSNLKELRLKYKS